MSETAVKMTVRPNGPLKVEGPVTLVDANGCEWDIAGKESVSLCRCGLSSQKPFCDGTHGKQSWKVDTYAPGPSASAETAAPAKDR